VAYALHHSCLLHYYLGMPTRLSELAKEQVRFCTDQGFPLFRATGTIFVATALIDGDAHGALPGLMRGLDAYRSTGAGLAVPYYFGLLGAALMKTRRPKEAEQALDKGLEIAMQNADRFHDAELHRLKGDLAMSQDHPAEEVEKHYQTAFEIAHGQQSRAMELRAATSAAKLAEGPDRPTEALKRLSTILSTFTEGLDTTDVTEARAVLDRYRS
jgi:predicted ATPase